MIVLDKFRGGRELVPGRELVHHHYAKESKYTNSVTFCGVFVCHNVVKKAEGAV